MCPIVCNCFVLFQYLIVISFYYHGLDFAGQPADVDGKQDFVFFFAAESKNISFFVCLPTPPK